MKHVCLVFGGNGSETEVSFNSSRAFLKALQELECRVTELNFDENFITNIQKIKPDVVFNGMHGTWGEDGTIQTLLNFLHIPYTHAGRLASIICINKELTKQIAKSLNIPTIQSYFCTKQQLLSRDFPSFPTSFIKPVEEGSAIGSVKFEQARGLSSSDLEIIKNVSGQFFLVEEYYDGKEVTIGVLGEKVIGGIEIMPKVGYYDYTAKYTKGKTEYRLSPDIPPELMKKLEDATLKIHKTIGIKSVSRADFLVKGDDFRFLEINTHPGFTETSLVPKMALNQGISFKDVVKFLLEEASFEKYNTAK